MSVRCLAVVLSLLGSACVWPDPEDDGVARCDNVDDCAPPDDSRWDVECVHGEDQNPSTSKVCAPVFRALSCDPGKYSDDHPFALAHKAATETTGVYVACEVQAQGTKGCAPQADQCDQGLVVNAFGVCDEPSATYPAVPATGRAGLDVRDQFCRNYFCDSDWMCDASTGVAVCRPCTPGGGSLGEGACGELYTKTPEGAAPSTVYDVDVSCDENGLSSDPVEAERLAGEKLGPIPGSG